MRRSRPKAPLERTEIAGTVAAVGSAVSRHRAGDRVRAGCFVDSCRGCDQGLAGQEQFRTGTGGSTATH